MDRVEDTAAADDTAAASAVEIAKGLRERLQLEHEARQSASAAKADALSQLDQIDALYSK